MMRILVADDDRDLCDDIKNFISRSGYEVCAAYDGLSALQMAKESYFDLAVLDVTMPYMSGIELTKKILEIHPSIRIILISGISDIIDSINAMELGIEDFLTKPFDIKKLHDYLEKVQTDLNLQQKEKSAAAPVPVEKNGRYIQINSYTFPDNLLLSHKALEHTGIFSEKMASIYKKLKKLQEYPDIPVLLEGETGTGKEIIARFIHYENSSLEGPFIGINCSNLSNDLFEAELFGYEKGSFTGADIKGRDGKIKLASKGTLFLDEVTEVSHEIQAKLLRVIQEREYYPVGSNKKSHVNTRFVFATNRDLLQMTDNSMFRKDLYYRLNSCKVVIPPLRERREEIIPFAVFFIKELNRKMNKKVEWIERKALQALEEYSWPGNVREIENLFTNLFLFLEKDKLDIKDFLPYLENNKEANLKLNLKNITIPDQPFSLEELNRTIVIKTLEKFDGNKTKAAEYLGLTRIQLYRRFKIS